MSEIKNSFAENSFLSVLQKLKEKLSKAQGDDYEDLQDYGLSEEDLEGLSVMDEPLDDEDEAARWLREQEDGGAEAQEGDPQEESGAQDISQESQEEEQPQEKKVTRRGSFRDWEPHGEYTDEHNAKMQELMDQGYSHREAERFVGAHKGPTDFQSALKHNIWPSQMSDKHLGELKDIAKHWLDNKDRMDKLDADPEKSPIKHASGQAMKRHEELTQDYNKAYNDFINSDEVKGLKGRERFKAVKDWKSKWHEENPDYHEKLAGGDVHQHFREAGSVGGGSTGSGSSGIMGQNINDRIDRIAGIGSTDAMSNEEAAQHVGGVKTEQGTQASTVRDPLSSGAIHPKQRELAQKQREQNTQKLLEQYGKPEQLDRLVRLRSAKSRIKGGNNDES